MPLLRQNGREPVVGMVQNGTTHQAVADHFNMSRITISWLMICLPQTVRTNIRPRNGRPHVTSQLKDRHLRLIQLRNRMITVENTVRRTPGLVNIRILGQTVRRLRDKLPVVGPILKQHHRTARLV